MYIYVCMCSHTGHMFHTQTNNFGSPCCVMNKSLSLSLAHRFNIEDALCGVFYWKGRRNSPLCCVFLVAQIVLPHHHVVRGTNHYMDVEQVKCLCTSI